MRLYRENGFEGVTIAAIAAEADIAPRTFFSYFACKEDVFLGAGDERLQRLVCTIEERRPGEPILAAARRELQRESHVAATGTVEGPARAYLGELMRHPAIVARLRARWNQWEDILSSCIAAQVGAKTSDPEPRLVAAAITAALRIAAEAAQRQTDGRKRIAERVFELLASGLADYGADSRGHRGRH
jgi:AcrR family transcriptional regulator